ncbi:unnamed protein product [Lepeophtheirus salmonis]|uniref:(salmon louse) hypothetical protein n=1 Tax=Lepeophtheirus salmonis TaxID=72036 RepID=A0A7R8D105_LEPSM|nr:unnamed protein product [Lepeophtheirus salmonis]CAF2989530.1 unnamed protein product [Lepeophtheirus salmonis]
MLENEKIHSDRRSRASSPSLPSLSTSSDVSSIHARSTPKIAACIIVTVLAVANPTPLEMTKLPHPNLNLFHLTNKKELRKPKNITTKSFDDDNIPIVPYFETPILRNPIRTKYTDGQDPEGPLQEKHDQDVLLFHQTALLPNLQRQIITLPSIKIYRSDNNGLPRDGTEGNRELHKGLINNIYQLVDTAQTEVNSSLRKNARASLPSHTSVRVPHGPSKPIQEQVNHGEHPESIFARFISKFRDRLTQNGPWAESEIPDIVQGRDFDHHSTSSLLFISLGILIMNALTQAPRDDGTPIEEEKDRAFHPSLLELESLFEGMKEESFAPHNSSLTFSKYVKLVESLKKMKDSDKPIGVDCIWQKYCTELNSNSYSEDSILKFIARLNSVGMKLIMSQIDGYELFTEFARSYQNWQPLPCKDIFKLCDKDKLSGLDKDLL